jgi:hypothetical protein
MMYHLGLTKQHLAEMSDEEWAEQYAILQDIRIQEAKQKM